LVKKVKLYKGIKKNSNSLKKVRVKTPIKRIEKDLRLKIFKYHFYTEYYIIALEFIRFIEIKKTVNIIFSKEPRITDSYLIIKD